MSRITLAIVVIAFGVLTFNSCIFDPKQEPEAPGPPAPAAYKDLSERDHVLFNLELAYNQRNINQYDRLLDENFVFHFSPLDVTNGNVTVSNWGRAAEIGATTNMFNPNFVPSQGAPISSIDLTMTYPDGEDTWNEVPQGGGEIWYEKTVSYLLSVVAGSTTYVSGQPIDASYLVREAEVDGKKFYRIVQWLDLAQ